jgi:hypothetical protein
VTIAEFFLALATDRELLQRFAREPDEVISEAGLDDERRTLLRTGSLKELRVKVEAEYEVENERLSIITIFTIPTIFAPEPPPKPDDS